MQRENSNAGGEEKPFTGKTELEAHGGPWFSSSKRTGSKLQSSGYAGTEGTIENSVSLERIHGLGEGNEAEVFSFETEEYFMQKHLLQSRQI